MEINDENKRAGYLGKNGDKDIVKKNGMLLHKRTRKDYNEIWNYFLEKEAEEYCEKLGYSIKTIEKIGYKKFIDANDWRDINDISKWKTDRVHIIPCIHCKNEFTTFELDLGLCKSCTSNYDLKSFSEKINEAEKNDAGSSFNLITNFVYNDMFRNTFLKK